MAKLLAMKVIKPWWAMPYIYIVGFTGWLFRFEPDVNKVVNKIVKHSKFHFER